jgi:hypothetical protein
MKRKVVVTEKTYPHGYRKPPVVKVVGTGKFHRWGVSYEEFESGPGNFTVAIVEMEDGTVLTQLPEDIKFIPRLKYGWWAKHGHWCQVSFFRAMDHLLHGGKIKLGRR